MPSGVIVGAGAGMPAARIPSSLESAGPSLGRTLSAKLSMVRQIVEMVCRSPKGGAAAAAAAVAATDAEPEEICQSPKEMAIQRCPYSAVAQNPDVPYEFRMPLHYPRYTKLEYESMPEWQLNRLLEEYGLPATDMGCLKDKREYAIGAFLWYDQLA